MSAVARGFAQSLGPGVNVMATNIRFNQLDDHDFAGLGHRVGHVRLCGDVLKGLINWSTCPGTSWRPPANASDDDAIAMARERILADPGFARYKRAAQLVLSSGLRLVLNPLHKKWMLTLDVRTLQLFWGVMAAEFDAVAFPPDRVAFEMANEPGNWNTWHVDNRAMDFLPNFVRQIGRAQPNRVLILPAGEMGYPRCGPDGPAAHFVQSWQAAVGDGAIAFARYAHASHAHTIATFHYYDPRWFTNQPESEERSWSLASGRPTITQHFDTVRAAIPAGVPIYVGEFGLNVPYTPPQDGADWLLSVRAEAEARGMAWALWTYYMSDEGVVSGTTGWERLRDWDCSPLVAAVFNFTSPSDDPGREECGGLQPFSDYSVHPDPHEDGGGGRRSRGRRTQSCGDHRPGDVPEPTIFLPSPLPFPPCSPAPPPFRESPPPPAASTPAAPAPTRLRSAPALPPALPAPLSPPSVPLAVPPGSSPPPSRPAPPLEHTGSVLAASHPMRPLVVALIAGATISFAAVCLGLVGLALRLRDAMRARQRAMSAKPAAPSRRGKRLRRKGERLAAGEEEAEQKETMEDAAAHERIVVDMVELNEAARMAALDHWGLDARVGTAETAERL